MKRPHSFHAYTLCARNSGAARHGALLRLHTDFGVGYADLHPWPELGDAAIGEQIRAIERGEPTALGARSLSFARADAIARDRGESLFSGLTPPASHALFLSPLDATPARVESLWSEGFRVFKTKAGPATLDDIERLLEILPSGGKLRIDFNRRLGVEQAKEAWTWLARLVDKIDFVEDFWPDMMEVSAVPGPAIALDRDGEEWLDSGALADVVIYKPAVQDGERLARSARAVPRWVVTSYLDHPLGQTCAAWEAAKLARRWPERAAVAGLLSHRVYERSAFSERLSAHGPHFVAPSGAGFGFGDLLESLSWERA